MIDERDSGEKPKNMLQDKTMRTALIPMILLASLFYGPAAADDIGSQWNETGDRSAMDDSLTVILWTGAEEPMPKEFGGSTVPRLVVRCHENRTSIYVDYDQYITTGDVDDEHQVRYRIDNRKPVSVHWGVSSDFEALGVWRGAVGLVQEVSGAEKFIVQTIPYGRSAETTTFDVSGLDKRLAPLAKACNWTVRPAEARKAPSAGNGSTQEGQAALAPAPAPSRTLNRQDLSALVSESIGKCWNIDPGLLQQYRSVGIEIRIESAGGGEVLRSEIVDKGRMARDRAFRALAESAQRAAMNPRCRSIPGLPPGTTFVTLTPDAAL